MFKFELFFISSGGIVKEFFVLTLKQSFLDETNLKSCEQLKAPYFMQSVARRIDVRYLCQDDWFVWFTNLMNQVDDIFPNSAALTDIRRQTPFILMRELFPRDTQTRFLDILSFESNLLKTTFRND